MTTSDQVRVRQARRTEGLSPKAPAAALGALLAPGLARLIAALFDIDVDQEGLEAAILLILSALGGLTGAYVGKPGKVVVETSEKHRID